MSLASGIALGREGPSVQVGAGIASALGCRLGLSPANVKALVPIGAAAALAAQVEQIWDARLRICGPATSGEEALSRVMAQLAR